MVNKSVKFKDLGLLIVDEEQKFGVAVKEKLRDIKTNVDVLTLTATPIPRTLQFSLMAARDLSVITTPPPNRYPIESDIVRFNESFIRDGIQYELQRGGQIFFIHNRVENILEVAGMIQRLVPDARVTIGHGQMEGNKLEKTHGKYPHGAMHFPATDHSSAKRLHPKATCPKCNYSVVLSLKSIQIGPPICPKDKILMVKQGRW